MHMSHNTNTPLFTSANSKFRTFGTQPKRRIADVNTDVNTDVKTAAHTPVNADAPPSALEAKHHRQQLYFAKQRRIASYNASLAFYETMKNGESLFRNKIAALAKRGRRR